MTWQGAIETTVHGLGYELVDAEKSAGGLLRVLIDHSLASPSPAAVEVPVSPPGLGSAEAASEPRSITVDDCEKVTRQLQHVLEVEGCDYQRLEVSSPGLDRPLKTAGHYRRFVGEQVELTLKMPFKGRKKYKGQLAQEGNDWRLLLEAGGGADAEQHALDFTLDEVREARLVPVVDFKGRRKAAAGGIGGKKESSARQAGAHRTGARQPGAGNEVDGGRIQ